MAAKKHVILCLAANPSSAITSRSDPAARAIHVDLQSSGYRDRSTS